MFTKYDQFLRNVEMHLLDYPSDYPDSSVSEAAARQFQDHYLHPLGDDVRYVRLESRCGVECQSYELTSEYCSTEMHRHNAHYDDLIEKTAVALNEDAVALMLVAVRNNNLKLSVKVALNRSVLSVDIEWVG